MNAVKFFASHGTKMYAVSGIIYSAVTLKQNIHYSYASDRAGNKIINPTACFLMFTVNALFWPILGYVDLKH